MGVVFCGDVGRAEEIKHNEANRRTANAKDPI